MNQERIPKIGDVVEARGRDGAFWVSQVTGYTETVQLRPIEYESFTTKAVPWSAVRYLEEPGQYDREAYSTETLRELALECYTGYLSQTRIAANQIPSNGHGEKVLPFLDEYDCLVAILRARGEGLSSIPSEAVGPPCGK